MPEILEIERYRRLAEAIVGKVVHRVEAPDAWYVKGGATPAGVRRAMAGRTVTAARRRGKLLLLDTDGPTLGLRFGMTGKLLVDGADAVGDLEYGSSRDLPGWDRVRLRFRGGGTARVNDPRRLGGVELDPDEDRLGPDAWSVSRRDLAAVLAPSEAPLKARLLDQHALAGIGNLLADEILWRAGLDPARPASTLADPEVARLHRTMRATLDLLDRRGGSHCGDLQSARARGARCPRDGALLQRRTVGGRTTYSCPAHQG